LAIAIYRGRERFLKGLVRLQAAVQRLRLKPVLVDFNRALRQPPHPIQISAVSGGMATFGLPKERTP
jgi:hypothetical protein